MRRFLYLIFFLLAVNTGYAAAIKHVVKKHDKAILKTDSSRITTRNFNKSALKVYTKQPEFQYQETTTDISWWTRFWRWFWNWIGHLFSFGSKHSTAWGLLWQIIELLLLLSGVAAVVFVIFKSQGINILAMFRRKSATASIPYSEFFEDINEINFDAEIENAIAKHNYRFAVRLLYLRCLKRLSDSGLIEWQIDKTNSTYINELTNQDQREAFGMLTRQFEYVWYGEFLIDGQVYKNINSSFQDFNKRVA
jgi:hypothetical protein